MFTRELAPVRIPERERFNTTHWSVVFSAADRESPKAEQALEKLCHAYWYPLYAFVRRSGHSPHEAEDLTQGFFERLLSRNFLASARPESGRFRSFLLAALKNYIINEWQASRAQKRGGKRQFISLDEQSAEGRYQIEPADHLTPEHLFDRRWALTVMQRVMERLQAEYAAAGKTALFDELKGFLAEKQPTPHAEIAAKHGISANAVCVAIHRLRHRYAGLLREEISHTVKDPADVDDEIRHLIAALGL